MEQAAATATFAPCARCSCLTCRAPQTAEDCASKPVGPVEPVGPVGAVEAVETGQAGPGESSDDESSSPRGSPRGSPRREARPSGPARSVSPAPCEEAQLLGRKETVAVITRLLREFPKAFGEHRGELYTVKDLAPFRRLGHGVPVAFRQERKPFDRAGSDEEFRSRLGSADPLIAGLPFGKLGLVLAGGSVSAHLMRVQDKNPDLRDYDDYDLFLVGHTPATATLAIRDLHEILADGEPRKSAEHRARPPMVYRTPGCITYVSERLRLKVQVVLRLYLTVAEVINRFDLGSSSMAWDGAKLHFTRAGLVAANHGANVVFPIARRGSFERRLIKYFDRGYDVALPGLNVQALADCGYQLPYLEVHPVERASADRCECLCRLECFGLSATSPAEPGEGAGAGAGAGAGDGPHSMYGSFVPYGDVEKIRLRNYREGVKPEGPNASALCGCEPYAPGMDYGAIRPEYPSADDIKKEARYHCGTQVIRPDQLRRCLGEAAARRYAILHMGRVFPLKGPYDRSRAVDQILDELVAETLGGLPRLAIPFELPAAKDQDGGRGLTDRQWYGAAYRRGLIDSAAIDSWWARQERGKAFAAGQDYDPAAAPRFRKEQEGARWGGDDARAGAQC